MDEVIRILVVKYITGQARKSEIRIVKDWIRESPDNERAYVQFYEAWHNALYADKQHAVDTEAAYQHFRRNTSGPDLHLRLQPLFKYAVAAVLVLVLGVTALYIQNKARKIDLITIQVPKGHTRKLILADGSSVWINAGTQLSYDRGFGKTNRTVYLKGEAYFDIKPSKEHLQFLVKTPQFTITDIGTVFNVKAYPEEKIFETTVVEGKVSVEGKLADNAPEKSKVFLEAQQVLKVNLQKYLPENDEQPETELYKAPVIEPVKVVKIGASDIDEYSGWKDGLLVFEDDSFEEIARILERRFNVQIIFTTPGLTTYRYTGTFKNTKDVYTVLDVIRKTTPLLYTNQDSTIVLRAKN